MEKKFKKQRRNITIKITCVLLAVWLVVSVAFCAITLSAEKKEQIEKSNTDYNLLFENLASLDPLSYNEMCVYIDLTKGHYFDILKGDIEEEEITCGADTGNYDTDMQITMYSCAFSSETADYEDHQLITDSDKEIYFLFQPAEYSQYSIYSGLLNYDEFVSSMTQEQLKSIKKYLSIKKDKDGYFYLLINKECYYSPENGHVYPKTVEIAKVYEDSFGYAVSETIETYELNVENTEKLDYYAVTNTNEPIFIDGKFVFNDFSSGGLIEDPFERLNQEEYNPYTGVIEKDGLFTYTFNESGQFFSESAGYEGSESDIAYRTAIYENVDQSDEEPVISSVGLRYAKRVNLLHCCQDTLIFGVSALFLFFLIIGVILTIMMCKVMKTQITQEQKRVEVTNALAHDIKTPLFIISGYAENLKENVNTDKREHYAQRIIERTQEVNELVHKMLDFSRLDLSEHSLSLEDFDVSACVKELIAEFEDSDCNRKFELDEHAPCTVSADKVLMHRVLSNLIDNAVRYSDDNSKIVFEVNDKMLSISNVCSNITQEDVSHLCEPYYRVEKNRESKGNGLGLSIVKSVLDMHGYKLLINLHGDLIIFTIKFS